MSAPRPLLRSRVSLPLALFLALLADSPRARNGGEPLNHYGLVTLSDNAVGTRLGARFKAKGQPVFLVHDVNAGLGQNDIMRFADKAVLIDADVWSTLQAEGALEKLKAAPIVRVQGRANSASWEQRAGLVGGDRQRKAFKLGAELLRVLEETFGNTPPGSQISFVFEQNHLTLLAPSALLDQLSFSAVRKVAPPGKPRIVSRPPDTNHFVQKPFEFQIWGVDPTDPSGELTYRLQGDLPPGLSWNSATNTLRGTPSVPGRWRLSAHVQNAAGMQDTLQFLLRFRVNQPPAFPGTPHATAVVGREWRYDPMPSDPDHPGYALTVRPGQLPAGMFFHPDSGFLRWTPDPSLAGTRHNFSLTVEDPLGAKRELRHTVQVVAKEGLLLSEGIKIELPWDTLVRGRSYLWRTSALTAAWAGQGIQLLEITGPDSTAYLGDSLKLRPMLAGDHALEFRFLARGNPLTQGLTIPVREDLPPEFVTELPEWKITRGSGIRRYRPVALDPEGEPVSLNADFPEDSLLQWDGKRLYFSPLDPGIRAVRFTASDAGGKTAEQWVSYRTKNEKAPSQWILENRIQGQFTAWSLTADLGTGRVGLYFPNFSYGTIPYSYWFYKEPPFLYFGGNLLGRRAEAMDRTLWADFGFTFRTPAPQVVTGGLFVRLNGEWHFPESPLSWIEMEAAGHVHQVMVATDSATLFQLLANKRDIIARDTLSRDGTLSKIIRDGFRGDNMNLFSRIEALGPLGFGVYAGPSLWREDNSIQKRHVQRLGGAIRFRRIDEDSDLYQLTFRLGWSPGGEGMAAYASMRMAFGRAD